MKSILSILAICGLVCASLFSSAQLSFAAADNKPAGENPYEVERSWSDYFLEHQKLFTEKAGTYKAGKYPVWTVHVPGGWIGNSTIIEGKVNPDALIQLGMQSIASNMSGDKILQTWRYQVDADKAGDTRMLLGFDFTDSGDSYSVELRNSILEIRRGSARSVVPRVSLTTAQLQDILSGKQAPAGAGDIADLNRLLGYLDRKQAGFYMHMR